MDLFNAQFTLATPTRLNCKVASRRRRRCELGFRGSYMQNWNQKKVSYVVKPWT